MLEGLEVKEILFSNLNLDNEKFRLDDEFFQKKYINIYSLVKLIPNVIFEEIIEILTDYHANGNYETLKNHVDIFNDFDYAYMIRSTDLEKSNFEDNVKYVSEFAYNYLSKSKLDGGEILINKIGSPGKVYLMPILDKPATLGMNLFMIKLKKKSGFNERFIWTFLNSSIGKKIIYRKVNGTVPLTIDKQAIRSLYIPKLSKKFQIQIEKFILESESLLKRSKYIYKCGENIFFDNIKFKNFLSNLEKFNIKSFKESFLKTGRLDAEYYQVKYENYQNCIFNYSYGDSVAIS